MRYEKMITINLGQYQSLKIGISDAPSFFECDKYLVAELKRLKLPVNDKIKIALAWQDEKHENR